MHPASIRVKAFVTGSTGAVGAHLVRKLLARGHDVAVLLRENANPWRIADVLPSVQCISGDMRNLDHFAEQLREFGPDAVFHLAWQGAGSYTDQNQDDQVFCNLDGGLKLVQLAARLGCTFWCGMGSVLEYGHYPVPLSEDTVAAPESLYGVTKYSLGLLAHKLSEAYGMRFAWFRLFWAYGPMDVPTRLIPLVILSLLRRQRPVLTPGEQLWDYVYVTDVVDALCSVAEQPQASGFFNLGSGKAVQLRSVVEQIRDYIDSSLPVRFGDISYRPDQIMHLQADMSRLQSATGWHPEVSLHDGLAQSIAWFREHLGRYE